MLNEGFVGSPVGAGKNGTNQGPQVVVTGVENISNNRQQYFDAVLGIGKTVAATGTLNLLAGSGALAELVIRYGILTNNGTINNNGIIHIA